MTMRRNPYARRDEPYTHPVARYAIVAAVLGYLFLFLGMVTVAVLPYLR